MPVTGRKPQEYRRHRVPPTHDWTDVVDVPFEDGPELPAVGYCGKPWPKAAITWWRVISRMPHCVLWRDSDWLFALTTAYIAAAFCQGNLKLSHELRARERTMGTTADALRDMRIRYVDPAPEGDDIRVSALDEYRKRLGAGR
jgi:hypothetical protein